MEAASSTNLNHGFPTPGPQSPTGQRVMDHVFFLSNTEWKNAREEANFDFVVIGTGFCCLGFIERALERDPNCRILAIERGPFFLPEHFQNLPLPFKDTLGGLSETFPWTLSATTASGEGGPIRWQHGMGPFFGGRSTLWSAWCPRPKQNEKYDEMAGWPQQTIDAAERNFESAEKLLHVQKTDKVDESKGSDLLKLLCRKRPVYGLLQKRVQDLLEEHATSIPGIYRTEAAPIASAAENVDGIDFQKFATPGPILEIEKKQAEREKKKTGAALGIVSDCIVEKIVQQQGQATALQTSRGVLPLGAAKLILAMGTLPPTTLVSNSFPDTPNVGKRFSAHFITSIVAKVPKEDLDPYLKFGSLELGACYIAGVANGNDRQQYHIQLTALWDENPDKNAGTALRYMPDVVATASLAQLQSAKGCVLYVCAVLGELDYENKDNWFHPNSQDTNITTNSLLQITTKPIDLETWKAMDEATFSVLEKVLSPKGANRLQYWHGTPDEGDWDTERPPTEQIRVDATVHESSTLYIGEEEEAPVDLDYKLRGSENVYITGGALWPQGGSWNPTLTMVALAQDLADNLVEKASYSGLQ